MFFKKCKHQYKLYNIDTSWSGSVPFKNYYFICLNCKKEKQIRADEISNEFEKEKSNYLKLKVLNEDYNFEEASIDLPSDYTDAKLIKNINNISAKYVSCVIDKYKNQGVYLRDIEANWKKYIDS